MVGREEEENNNYAMKGRGVEREGGREKEGGGGKRGEMGGREGNKNEGQRLTWKGSQ